MEVTTARRSERPAGLDASTVAEAFQLTAAAHPDRPALRLKEDEFAITWREYADKVRRTAARYGASANCSSAASVSIWSTA